MEALPGALPVSGISTQEVGRRRDCDLLDHAHQDGQGPETAETDETRPTGGVQAAHEGKIQKQGMKIRLEKSARSQCPETWNEDKVWKQRTKVSVRKQRTKARTRNTE